MRCSFRWAIRKTRIVLNTHNNNNNNNNNNNTQLQSNAEGLGCKSYETDSEGRDTTAPSRSRLYHLPVFVLEASTGVFVYAYLHTSSAYIISPVIPHEGQHEIFIGPPIILGEQQNNSLTACTVHWGEVCFILLCSNFSDPMRALCSSIYSSIMFVILRVVSVSDFLCAACPSVSFSMIFVILTVGIEAASMTCLLCVRPFHSSSSSLQ